MSTRFFEGLYTDGFVQVNRLNLHYTDWNPGADQCVFLAHGANVQLHTWDPIAADLARDYRVIAIDLRGHGDSDWAREGYQVASFVSDIRGMIDALELPPVHYVGHSLGARVGIAYAGAHPDTVRTVTLSDAGPELPRDGALAGRAIVGMPGEKRGFRTEEEALALYEQLHPEWKPVFRELHAAYQLRRNWAGRLVFKVDPDLFWITGSAGARDNDYVWEMSAKITAPVLMMWGNRSPFLNDAIVNRLAEQIPSFELARPDTGHYVPREDPDGFLELVRGFIADK
jgi:pimeloyl-ACP methyl ester carboxylesterase